MILAVIAPPLFVFHISIAASALRGSLRKKLATNMQPLRRPKSPQFLADLNLGS